MIKDLPRAECTWGDGPDVLLIVKEDPCFFFDLTIKGARKLARSLDTAADRAEQLEEISGNDKATA